MRILIYYAHSSLIVNRKGQLMKDYVFVVYDESFFLWVIKMLLSAILTPLWIVLVGLGLDFDFN